MAKRDYETILREWKEEAKLDRLDYVVRVYYSRYKDQLNVMTSRPSALIGRRGILANKYRDILKEECDINEVHIFELASWV